MAKEGRRIPPTINPRFFFSSHYAEWITDQPAPEGDAASAAEWAHQIAEELGKDETIQFTLDMEYSLAIFSTSGMVDGKRVSVTIEAPWLYLPVVDYPSHSRFTLDLSWLTLSVDGETVTVHSSQFWTDAEVLLPTLFTVDFFFYSPQSGVWLERVDFNDGTSSLSDRVTFGL